MVVDTTKVQPREQGLLATGSPYVVFTWGSRRAVLELKRSSHVVGRSPDAELCIDCDGVSREHARFTAASDGVVHVLDLGSTNGTSVNDEPVSLRVLRDGDRIKLGAAVQGSLRYRKPGTTRLDTLLTNRQLEIAEHVARGQSTAQIAETLGLSPKTIGNHLEKIYVRAQLSGRVELTRLLLEQGLAGP